MTTQIDAIRKRLARITPGRWEWQPSRYLDRKGELYAIDDASGDVEGVIELTSCGILVRSNHDADFIEHAPADVTALLAALDAANAENERLRRQYAEGDHR